jgi:hypothetical protein
MNRWLFLLAISGGLIGCADQDMLDDESDDSLAQTVALDGSVVTPSSMDAGALTPADAGARDGGDSGVSTVIGQPCVADSDCASPATKCNLQVSIPFGGLNINFAGGYCTKPCTASAECGAGAACPLSGAASFLPDISVCLKQCTAASDCREGYNCQTLPSFPGGGSSGAAAGKHCLPPLPFPGGGGI